MSKKTKQSKKRLLVFPNSRLLANGLPNPKNYPCFADVIRRLRELGIYTVQCGTSEETSVGCDERFIELPLAELCERAMGFDGFLSVDSFFPHAAHALMGEYVERNGKLMSGVVVWTITDHAHFGYPQFTNVYGSFFQPTPIPYAVMEVVAESLRGERAKAFQEKQPTVPGISTVNVPLPERVVEAVLSALKI